MDVLMWLLGYIGGAGVIIAGGMLFYGYITGPTREPEPERELPPERHCGHGQLVEVESAGEIVAYICQRCDEQVMPDNRAAVAHEDRKRVDAEWRETWKLPTRQQQEAEEIALAKLEIQE